ncbi:MAG: hypothetical protein ACW967_01330 [Candidatus Hodarchaeales archaeon]
MMDLIKNYLKVTVAVILISIFSTLFYYIIAITFQNEPNVIIETEAFLLAFVGLSVLGMMLNTTALVFNLMEIFKDSINK